MKIIYFLAGILVLFLCSCTKEGKILPRLLISTNKDIRMHKNISSDFIWVDLSDTLQLKGKVKYRGGHSLRYEKKSYAVEFTEKVMLAELPLEDDWVLNASYIDKTFMRHKLGYDLFMKMSRNNKAPLSTYITVFENGRYKGIFILMQKLTANVLDIKQDGLLFKEPPVFYAGEMKFQEDSNLFQQKFPKIRQKDKKEILLQFREFLLQSDEKEFAEKIYQWVDIQNVADWYTLVLFANAGDNIVKNFYLYKTDARTPFRIALWDFDHSFGRDGDGERNLMKNPANFKSSVLFTRLRENPYLNFNALLEQRWKTLRENDVISYKEINKMIAENHEKIYPYISQNQAIWPYDSPNYFDNNNYYQEIAFMRSFIKNRIIELDKIFCYPDN